MTHKPCPSKLPDWGLPMKIIPNLTYERLRELLHYEPETGVFTWRVKRRGPAKAGDSAGYVCKDGYIEIGVWPGKHAAHRLAWFYVHGEWPKQQIDHINGVKTDNRINNLRDVSPQVNSQNERKARRNSRSGLLGVGWDESRGRWAVSIRVGGKRKHLGRFKDAADAHAAYIAAKRMYHDGCTI